MENLIFSLSLLSIGDEANFVENLRRLKTTELRNIVVGLFAPSIQCRIYEELIRRELEVEANKTRQALKSQMPVTTHTNHSKAGSKRSNDKKQKNTKQNNDKQDTKNNGLQNNGGNRGDSDEDNGGGTYSMYPEYHDLVAAELPYESLVFHNFDDNSGTTKYRRSNITGAFKCPNKKCHNRWTSKKIAIRIRLYTDPDDDSAHDIGHLYNARVYHQRCEECNSVATPNLNVDRYKERVVYWLKSWLGYEVVKPKHKKKRTPPHRQELCEGCKAGDCPAVDYGSLDEYSSFGY